jgi:hypothetical protein
LAIARWHRPLAAVLILLCAATPSTARADSDRAPALTLTLPPLNATERAWVADPASIPSPARLGFGRAVPEAPISRALADPSHWQATTDGGRRLMLQITSPGARGLRLGLAVDALPEGARLRVFSAQTRDLAPIRGAEILESLARDRAGAAASDTGEPTEPLYWTPLVLGETLALELRLPPGADPAALALRTPRLAHLFALPVRLPETAPAEPAPGACHRDLACADEPLAERLARATAILLYTLPDGASNACSGVLLADADPTTAIPYLVTAHHCIPDQARASSLETFWGHRAARCGEGPIQAPARVSGGAELLDAHKSLDTALLRLRGDPPPEAVFVEGSTTLPERGTEILSVHHPLGQPAKVARGHLSHYWHCAEVAYCGPEAAPERIHYVGVTWSTGPTSAGSSGAGAFRADTGALVGVLTGGLSTCEHPSGPDDFGRFDRALREGFGRWLGGDERRLIGSP